ncbi:MAG: cell division protein SepF [Candidatus Thalassarchaeaceae archaeon]|nr:cell division protein SepF [Candidatus Thalassarchaeaceae archaeon]
MAKETRPEPRWIEMPSLPVQASTATIEAGQDYHDLGELYADAPVARGVGDVIVHRAVLDDITGIPEILDWLSDGDIVILEMSRLLTAETELKMAVDKIQSFVEADMAGEVIRLGQSRLLLLPSTFDISEGESFAY